MAYVQNKNKVNMIACPACGSKIVTTAHRCPKCGAISPSEEQTRSALAIMITVIAVLGFLIAILYVMDEKEKWDKELEFAQRQHVK